MGTERKAFSAIFTLSIEMYRGFRKVYPLVLHFVRVGHWCTQRGMSAPQANRPNHTLKETWIYFEVEPSLDRFITTPS